MTEINAENISKEELLEIICYGRITSNHPIAISIVKAYGKEINKDEIKDYKEISGHGVKVTIRRKMMF